MHLCRKRRVIKPLKHLIWTHHARRRHRQQVGQVKLLPWCDAALHELAHPPRTYPHHRRFLLFGNPQQHLCIGRQWRSIISNTTSAEKRVHDTRLVHDPAGGGVLQTCIRGPNAPVDVDFLHHGQKQRANAVDESLGRACCAGGVDDERWILEVNADWRRRWLVGTGLDEVFEPLCLGDGLCIVGFGKALDDDKRLQLVAFRHTVDHSLDVVSQINGLAVVQGTIIKEDKLCIESKRISLISHLIFRLISRRLTYLWIHLHRPLQQPANAHIRRAAAEYASQPRRRQIHHVRPQRMAADNHHAVALLQASLLQCCRQHCDLFTKLPPCYVPHFCVSFSHLCECNLGIFFVQRVARLSRRR